MPGKTQARIPRILAVTANSQVVVQTSDPGRNRAVKIVGHDKTLQTARQRRIGIGPRDIEGRIAPQGFAQIAEMLKT